MVIFCILCLILLVGIICVALSKKFPIIGVIFIVLLVVFFYKSCEMYNEFTPKNEAKEEEERIENLAEERYYQMKKEEREKKRRERAKERNKSINK